MKHPHLAAALAAVLALSSLPARADGPQPMDVARTAWSRGSRLSRRVAALLDSARREHDVMRTMCLDDALSRIDSQLRLIEDRSERLAHATEAHDPQATARELRLLQYVARRMPENEILADACIGVVRRPGMREHTVVEMEVPADLPPDLDDR